MRKILLLLSLLTAMPTFAQITCQDYRTAVYCSNGLSAIKAGNTLYFSDGSTVTVYNQPIQRSYAQADINDSFAAGAAGFGAGIGNVIADVKESRRFDKLCDVDPYFYGMVNGHPGFCSKSAINDACPGITDYSGFKYTGDMPHALTSWDLNSGELYHHKDQLCVPDVEGHAFHEAQLWKYYLDQIRLYLGPETSVDDAAKIIDYMYAHPSIYKPKTTPQTRSTMYASILKKSLK